MNEYFVKVELYHNKHSLGTKCFIFYAENGNNAVHLVHEYIRRKNSDFLKPSEIPDDFELLDIHKL